VAAAFLRRRGLKIVAENRRIGRDEIDLLAVHAGRHVAVEVKTRIGVDPSAEFTDEQASLLRRAASTVGATRCDLIAVRVGSSGVEVRWLPGVC
jgi:Holliday junction resolvase-like predicted endonuclease